MQNWRVVYVRMIRLWIYQGALRTWDKNSAIVINYQKLHILNMSNPIITYEQKEIFPSRLELWNTPTASPLREKTSSNECPACDTKQSDSEVPAMLGLWGIRIIRSLLLLQGPLWPGMLAPIYGLIRTKLHTFAKLNCLN